MAHRKVFTREDRSNNARIDIFIDVEKGKVIHWCINVSYAADDGRAYDVYRIDTCHGFLHEQRFWQDGRKVALEGDWTRMYHEKNREVEENYARWIGLFRKAKGV